MTGAKLAAGSCGTLWMRFLTARFGIESKLVVGNKLDLWKTILLVAEVLFERDVDVEFWSMLCQLYITQSKYWHLRITMISRYG